MSRSLDDVRKEFGEAWAEVRRGVTYVMTWPDPDDYDDAMAGAMAALQGDTRKGLAACESITKACCKSHSPAELDAIRQDEKPKNLGLYRDLGEKLFIKLRPEVEKKGKG